MSQEAALTLLQNIYTFVCVARQAESPTVATWNTESVHNALQWAAYSQELAAQVSGRALEPVLEGRLEEMSHLLKVPHSQSISLKFLSKALDILIERLVCNPHLPDSLLQNLTQTVKIKYSVYASTLQHCLALAQKDFQIKATVASQLKELGAVLKSGGMVLDFTHTCVRLLLEQLTLWFEMEHNCDRFEKQLESVVEELSQLPNGWSVLVMCLSVDMSKVEQEHKEGLRYVQNCIAAWMERHHPPSGPKCPLWQVAPSLLVQAAGHSVQFCGWYVNALIQLTESLEARCLESHATLDTVHLPTWSSSERHHGPAFFDVVQHFCHLLNADREVKNKTLTVLTSKTSGSSLSIWTQVTKTLINQCFRDSEAKRGCTILS